jgi:hypothetical protein
VPYVECSAKTGEGVEQAFLAAVGLVLGGWRTVAGMATPRHVPSEAFLAQRLPAALAAADKGAKGTTETSQQRCCLQ